jgi:hypothetical protein
MLELPAEELEGLTPEQQEFIRNLAAGQELPQDRAARADAIQEQAAILDVTSDRAGLSEAARTNLDFLASLILTDIYEYGYPPLFHAIWQLITTTAMEKKGKPKYALGIPRGFSKTVVLKLYVTWLILFSDRRFILVVCNTAKLAENFLSDVTDMLNNINIRNIFGAWNANCEQDTLAFKKFSFRNRNIVLAALGAGSSLRGLNLKFVRPDCVIMDDMQNRDEAANPEIAKQLLIWMLGTLMKACHPHRCIFIFVGNMYPFEGSILRKLKHSPEWLSFITGAILADGNSLWPEHRSLEDLLSELQSDTDMGHPEIFFSEVMNDEDSGTVSGIDVSKIPECPDHLDAVTAQGGCIIIDPSLGRKKGDDLGIGAFLIYDGTPVLRELIVKKLDPGQTIQQATFLAVKYSMQLIICEGGAYQATLIYWFQQVYAQLGVSGINVGEITTGGMQKNARIQAALKQLLSGTTLLHKTVRSQVIYQITQWNPLKTNNKDEILDLLAYIHKAIELFPDWMPLLISDTFEDNIPESSYTSNLAIPF